MSTAYEDCHYLARTLAISLMDLELRQQAEIIDYLDAELKRLKIDGTIGSSLREKM
jgi:hypothetical protein